MNNNKDKKTKFFLDFNLLLCIVLILTLILNWFKIFPKNNELILIIISLAATLTVFLSAIRSLKNKKVSIDLLASIALAVSLYEREWVSAIFINLMIASAKTFIDYVKIRSHSAIKSLLKLKPKVIKIVEDGKVTEIPVERIKEGDRVIIELGETIAVDGIVEEGEATIDQSSLTGESIPIFKRKGDNVLSFTTVVSGHLVIKTEKVGKETTFEKIIALVEQSQANKAPIYTLINKFANWYIILTITASVVVYLLSKDVNLILGLLLVSCADDIAVATPLALMSAITHSAKHGTIIKGGDYLEALSKLKVIIFDKTGTLTRGKLKIKQISPLNHKTEKEVLELAAAACSFSNHPVSQAVVNYAGKKNITSNEPTDFEEHEGRGIVATYKDKKIIIGKLPFFQELNIKITPGQIIEINKEMEEGLNVSLVGYNDELVGLMSLEDEIRPKAEKTLKKLKKLGVEKTVMLTGDNEKNAEKVSKAVGIDEFHANLLPADKLEYLKKNLNKKYKVAMVGDGVNDAPTLALSDVGIVMGAIGSDTSVEAADVALMKDDLSQIPELMRIGKSTMGIIRQNLLIWGVLNILGFSLVFMHVLSPSGAAAYNFITDFIPIFNSLRLFK